MLGYWREDAISGEAWIGSSVEWLNVLSVLPAVTEKDFYILFSMCLFLLWKNRFQNFCHNISLLHPLVLVSTLSTFFLSKLLDMLHLWLLDTLFLLMKEWQLVVSLKPMILHLIQNGRHNLKCSSYHQCILYNHDHCILLAWNHLNLK